MKKIIASLLVAAAPAVGFSQVQLISGFNFGQFVGAGYPSTDGVDFGPINSISSNYTNTVSPGNGDSGVDHGSSGVATPFSAGVASIYWDGSNGSSAWDYTTGNNDVSVIERGSLVAINHNLVNGLQMFAGDDNNAALRLRAGGHTDIALAINTSGFADFDPSAFSQPNDFNFTFAAFAYSGGSASIEWLYNGSSLGVSTAAAGEYQAFSVDLPADFYGNANAILIGRVVGDIVLDNVQINGVTASAIPEPSTYAALVGVLGLGFAAGRRRRSV